MSLWVIFTNDVSILYKANIRQPFEGILIRIRDRHTIVNFDFALSLKSLLGDGFSISKLGYSMYVYRISNKKVHVFCTKLNQLRPSPPTEDGNRICTKRTAFFSSVISLYSEASETTIVSPSSVS